jgi:predicted 3-demethylubiquinone-9 3-methyltransferase (glyoxalase superfamily)
MQKITTFLTYEDQAEEAVKLYTSLFESSRVIETRRYGDAGPCEPGSVMTISFELERQPYVALNGGASFSFSTGISLLVTCDTQEEVDRLWEGLTAGGGEPGRCGWLTDRFGVSWQVVPRVLSELVGDPDPEKAQAVMSAMLQMGKIEIAGLQEAYDAA